VPDGADPPPPAEAQLRARAREELARELHDELTHRVASVSLQVMGHRSSDDVAQLRWSLDTIAVATAEILAHLWLLDRVLRAHPFDVDRGVAGAAPGLEHLVVRNPVTAVVDRGAEALREAGFRVDAVVPDSADGVGPLARRTLEEALQAAGAAIDRHGTPGGRCAIEVTTSPGWVSLRVTAPLSGWTARAGDPTLVALQERVRLTEGTLWAGHADRPEHPGPGSWSFLVRLRDR
jgi:hypothetical protein